MEIGDKYIVTYTHIHTGVKKEFYSYDMDGVIQLLQIQGYNYVVGHEGDYFTNYTTKVSWKRVPKVRRTK